MGHLDLIRELQEMGAIRRATPTPVPQPVPVPVEVEPVSPAKEAQAESEDAPETDAGDVEDAIAALTAGFRTDGGDEQEEDEDLAVEEVEDEEELPSERPVRASPVRETRTEVPYGPETGPNFENVSGQLKIITEELDYVLRTVQRLQKMAARLAADIEED